MGTFNVHDAKTHFSRLLDRVSQGEEIIITKSGRPVAKLVRVAAEPRKPGRLKGRIRIAPDRSLLGQDRPSRDLPGALWL